MPRADSAEEPGWRGYALPRLKHEFGPLRGIVLLAILWTAWYLPMFLYKGWTTSPLWIYAPDSNGGVHHFESLRQSCQLQCHTCNSHACSL
ncbi:MAG: hypothetical protein DMG97_17435 [Acidobacteria bacterium]|nr:MAG: hypothetical protein DMG98_13970 [Acidobacteriota bacterium]PYV68232.1 MAG: hypothetical protein DMG96_37005 [Acidobacteriota bacterium]PYV71034.1 MAG: hypothetical protein DMG97_17435 [Acidobacteriota bacterium]